MGHAAGKKKVSPCGGEMGSCLGQAPTDCIMGQRALEKNASRCEDSRVMGRRGRLVLLGPPLLAPVIPPKSRKVGVRGEKSTYLPPL